MRNVSTKFNQSSNTSVLKYATFCVTFQCIFLMNIITTYFAFVNFTVIALVNVTGSLWLADFGCRMCRSGSTGFSTSQSLSTTSDISGTMWTRGNETVSGDVLVPHAVADVRVHALGLEFNGRRRIGEVLRESRG